MKISNITQNGFVFFVIKKPNLLQRLFGRKPQIEKYKRLPFFRYIFFPECSIYINEKGEELGATHSMTKILDRWQKKF